MPNCICLHKTNQRMFKTKHGVPPVQLRFKLPAYRSVPIEYCHVSIFYSLFLLFLFYKIEYSLNFILGVMTCHELDPLSFAIFRPQPLVKRPITVPRNQRRCQFKNLWLRKTDTSITKLLCDKDTEFELR